MTTNLLTERIHENEEFDRIVHEYHRNPLSDEFLVEQDEEEYRRVEDEQILMYSDNHIIRWESR